jgi:hypothetical protein
MRRIFSRSRLTASIGPLLAPPVMKGPDFVTPTFDRGRQSGEPGDVGVGRGPPQPAPRLHAAVADVVSLLRHAADAVDK